MRLAALAAVLGLASAASTGTESRHRIAVVGGKALKKSSLPSTRECGAHCYCRRNSRRFARSSLRFHAAALARLERAKRDPPAADVSARVVFTRSPDGPVTARAAGSKEPPAHVARLPAFEGFADAEVISVFKDDFGAWFDREAASLELVCESAVCERFRTRRPR